MDKTKKGKWTDKNLEKAYYNGCKDTREEFERLIDKLYNKYLVLKRNAEISFKEFEKEEQCFDSYEYNGRIKELNQFIKDLEQLKNQLRARK